MAHCWLKIQFAVDPLSPGEGSRSHRMARHLVTFTPTSPLGCVVVPAASLSSFSYKTYCSAGSQRLTAYFHSQYENCLCSSDWAPIVLTHLNLISRKTVQERPVSCWELLTKGIEKSQNKRSPAQLLKFYNFWMLQSKWRICIRF